MYMYIVHIEDTLHINFVHITVDNNQGTKNMQSL